MDGFVGFLVITTLTLNVNPLCTVCLISISDAVGVVIAGLIQTGL